MGLHGVLDGIVEACDSAGIEAGFGNSRLKDYLHAQAEGLGKELSSAVKARLTFTLSSVHLVEC